jgi:hypothetical protein
MNNAFENLKQEDRALIESRIYMTKQMIWNFYSKKYGVTFEEFECNETCVKYLEDYLASRIRTRILKWKRVGDSIVVTRVKTLSGVASNNQMHIQELLGLVMACSILLGQCIATIFDGKWIISADKTMIIEVFDTPVQTYWKCLKYVTLGNEDSLIGYVKYFNKYTANKALNEQVLNLLNLERQDYKRMENWMDKNGNVEKIVVFGNDNQIIKTVFVSIL